MGSSSSAAALDAKARNHKHESCEPELHAELLSILSIARGQASKQ